MNLRTLSSWTAAAALLGGCVPSATVAGPSPEAVEAERAPRRQRAESATVARLVALFDERRLAAYGAAHNADPVLTEIRSLPTPEGYRLRYRYREFVVPVVQALALSEDPQLKARFLEAARWNVGGVASDPLERARSAGLILLSDQKNPAHQKIFREALLDGRVSIRYAAVEAVEAWDVPEALPLLLAAASDHWSPLIRAAAAQAAWRRGAPEGRALVSRGLTDPNWLVRALSARTMGELGAAEDADALIQRIGPERDRPFVAAELCIAGLKLLAKRRPSAPRPPPSTRSRPRTPTRADLYELEPLVVTAPRLKTTGQDIVDVRIDGALVDLLEQIATRPPEEEIVDPVLAELGRLVTPRGFALYLRYTDLRYLLAEGLAGTSNLTLVGRLETLAARSASADDGVRALALVALGFDRTRTDLAVFERALSDPTSAPRVRFAAVEALAQQALPQARFVLADWAQRDRSAVVRLFAAQALAAKGDPQGLPLLRRGLDDPDPTLRAMATYYLGQWGEPEDFERLMLNLERESDDLVNAENCLAVLRLARQ